MKLYTKTGDDGTTGLFGGERVVKSDLRIEAYGTVDETNAAVGLAAAGATGRVSTVLAVLQARLFDVGADLATPRGSKHEDKVRRIDDTDVLELERLIDEFADQTPAIKVFVLPGGTELAARLHIARTVSRRAERIIVAFHTTEAIGTPIVHWINRLSDLFFAMARFANHDAGVDDVPWTPRV
jgi:cob(I)alamin adenosyltransferase